MPTTTTFPVTNPDHARIARSASIHAESIRYQVARTSDALEPLRAAWRRRAAELELASTVLWPEASLVAPLGRTA